MILESVVIVAFALLLDFLVGDPKTNIIQLLGLEN